MNIKRILSLIMVLSMVAAAAVTMSSCENLDIDDLIPSFNDESTEAEPDITIERLSCNADPNVDNAAWEDVSTGYAFGALWEPGCVVAYHIRLTNNSVLARKLSYSIVPENKNDKKSDVIDLYYFDMPTVISEREQLDEYEPLGTVAENGNALGTIVLMPGESIIITVALKMQMTAGQEYNTSNNELNFAFSVISSLVESEDDSFGADYDTDALNPQ